MLQPVVYSDYETVDVQERSVTQQQQRSMTPNNTSASFRCSAPIISSITSNLARSQVYLFLFSVPNRVHPL